MMVTLLRNVIFLALCGLCLGGCSLLGPVKLEDMNTYMVNTVPRIKVRHQLHPVTAMVALPEASPSINTTQMIYSTERYQLGYFSKNRWGDTPPQMLQSLMVQVLQNTHYFAGVGTVKMSGRYDYTLATQLVDFQQVFQGDRSAMHITLRAQWVKNATGHIVANKTFSIVEPAPFNSPYGGVIAANRGVAILLSRLAQFLPY